MSFEAAALPGYQARLVEIQAGVAQTDDVREALAYASALANEDLHLFTTPAA